MATKKVIKKAELKPGAESKEDKKEAEQARYMQLQMIDQQVRQLQQYLQSFDQQLMEIKNVIIFLKELFKLKKGDPIFAPLTNGIFVKAKLEDNKEVRVNVGNNVVVTRSIEEAVKMLEGQQAEVSQYRSDVLAKFEEMIRQAEALQNN